MGCSSSKPATDEEKQTICKVCAKDMMNLCVDDALANPDQVKVKAPTQLDTIRSSSEKLRVKAEELRQSVISAGEEDPLAAESAPAEGGGGGGGLFSAAKNLFNSAVGMAAEAVSFASDMSKSAASKALVKTADMLDEALKQVEEPMTTIGKDLVEGKKADINNTLKEFIKNADVPGATQLCLGTETDAISKALITAAADVVAGQLKAVVGEKVKEHKGMQAVSQVIETYNKMAAEVNKLASAGEDFKIEMSPIELDVVQHICKEVAVDIGRLMGEAEGKHREAPGNSGSFPDIFEKVFKKTKTEKDELTSKDYKAVTKK